MFTYPAVLDADTALGALEDAVTRKGWDYSMDADCLYVDADNGSPRCIVGVALSILGVPVHAAFINGGNGSQISQTAARDALTNVGVVLSEEATDVLRSAQVVQDDGGAWGKALVAAYRKRVSQLAETVRPPKTYEPPF